jgi:peptidoglycan/xylan/chitin deacetylase (PgdA/CDA1 family)
LSILISFLLFLGIQQFDFDHELHAQSDSNSVTNDKVVILNFDDGRKTQFTYAKPILDKYGFKATFYIVCNYLENKPGFMDWRQVKQLYEEGHDIGSHSMNHANLSKLSKKDLKFEVGKSKKCLEDHGIDVTSFAYPFNKGSNDKKVIKIVSKYYELARTAGSPITYLHCDGWQDQSNQKDCRTYTKKEDLTFANRYSIRGWSHDLSRLVNSYTDDKLLNRFIQVVNTQSEYNKDGTIKALPIIIYHRAGDNEAEDYNTHLKLFEKEMKYLHDNNFRVITMKDLGYEKKTDYIYIKSPNEPLLTGGGITSVSSGNQSGSHIPIRMDE